MGISDWSSDVCSSDLGISRPEFQVARTRAGPYRGPGTAILPSRYHSPAIIGRWPAHPEAGARMAAGKPTNEPQRGHPWHAASTRPSWSAISATTRKPNTRKVAWPSPRSAWRSEEHTYELQSLMRNSYAV